MTPPTPQRERKKDADGSTCGNRRDEPQSVSPKPKRDGATPDRIAFREHNQGAVIQHAKIKMGMTQRRQ
jgi:hypothetical protein